MIHYSTSQSGGDWTAPLLLSTGGQYSTGPQIVVDSSGLATAVWSAYNGSNLVIQARNSLNGGAWSDIATISKPGQTSRDPQLAVNAAGLATAVWPSTYGSTAEIQASTSQSGGTWSTTPSTISDPTQPSSSPQITVGVDGRATAVWSSYNGTRYIIRTNTSPGGGPWNATPTTISDPALSSSGPQVAVDPDGWTTAVWSSSIAGTSRNIIQSNTSRNGGAWSDTPATISDPNRSGSDPRVIADSNGQTTAMWGSTLDSSAVIQTSSAQRGVTWSDSVTISSASQASSSPKITAISAGRVLAIWRSASANGNFIQCITVEHFTSTATPTITGSAQVGQTLTVSGSLSWSPTPTSVTYAWKWSGTTTVVGTGDSYTPTAGDLGKNLTVTVTASLPGVASISVTSPPPRHRSRSALLLLLPPRSFPAPVESANH